MLFTGTLPTTASRGTRTWALVRTYDPAVTHDASLTVTETRGKRVIRTISSRYHVAEMPAIGHRGNSRKFLILKDAHVGDTDTVAGVLSANRVGDIYECVIGDGVEPSTCSCPAGCTGSLCVHIAALEAAIEAGWEHPLERPCMM